MSSEIYPGNDMLLIGRGLRDRDSALVETATVTVEAIKDENGLNIAGVTLPLAMNHVGDATYEAVIPHTLELEPYVDDRVFATVRADHDGKRGQWEEVLNVRMRRA